MVFFIIIPVILAFKKVENHILFWEFDLKEKQNYIHTSSNSILILYNYFRLISNISWKCIYNILIN